MQHDDFTSKSFLGLRPLFERRKREQERRKPREGRMVMRRRRREMLGSELGKGQRVESTDPLEELRPQEGCRRAPGGCRKMGTEGTCSQPI